MSSVIIFLSFIFELEGIMLLNLCLTVTMFHNGQKNVSSLFLDSRLQLFLWSTTISNGNLNLSNSQMSRGIEVDIAHFR